MTAKQYRAALAALGLTQLGAAEFLGVSPRQSQSWALGEYPVPQPVAILLRLMIALKLDADDVNAIPGCPMRMSRPRRSLRKIKQ